MIDRKSLTDRLKQGLPKFQMPTLGQTVEIPVYLIHNSADPEDYFFIFDFEQFVERSKSGMFVRPKLQVWAGRNDFSRSAFARQFRESFSNEFEAARGALARGENKQSSGWFSWSLGLDLIPHFAAQVVLLVALSAGKMVWSALPLPGFLRGKSDGEKLESSIAQTQDKVDEALAQMEVTLHKDLRSHAFRDGGPRVGQEADHEAWPLPQFVTEHLNDGASSSWW